MLATDKQINYLCSLAKKVEKVRIANEKDKTIVAHFPNYIDWQSERHLGGLQKMMQTYESEHIEIFLCLHKYHINSVEHLNKC